MIKETVDAVRLAEKKAEEVVETANANANDKKINMKIEAENYRSKALEQAREEAEVQMKDTIFKCEEYNNKKINEVNKKVEELKSEASKNFDKAVDAVISALI